MLHLIDKLAAWWLDWRTERTIAVDDEIRKFELKRFDATPEGMKLMAIAPGIAILADQAALLLEAHNAKNYIEFDMMPRLDRGLKPIRITVMWANGESPATKAARLEVALQQYGEHSAACERLQDAGQPCSCGLAAHVPAQEAQP